MPTDTSIKILRLREVQNRTGLPPSSIYHLIQLGCFPKPVRLSERRVGWLSTEIDEWIAARIQERDQAVIRHYARHSGSAR